jgi:hypothetical protein
LTDVLRGDQGLELLILVLLSQRTNLITVYFNVNVLDDLFENLVVDVGKILVELGKADAILVFLQEPDDIGLRSLLDKMLVLPRLRVVNFNV